MYYYFFSEYPVALKVNGVFFNIIHNAIQHVNIDSDCPFIEISPINTYGNTLNFILDQDFLKCPPKHVCITDLKGGFLIKFLKIHSDGEFKVFNQQKYGDLLVTVFNENGVKLSIETKDDFFVEQINTDCDNVNFYRPKFDERLLAVAFTNDKTLLLMFDASAKIKKVFQSVVDDFSFDNEFYTVEHFLDMAKHSLKITWEYDGAKFTEKERSISRSKTFNFANLPSQLIPYAFLEEFLLKGEYSPYLTDTILSNADKLHGFFGEFIGIMPPPIFRDITEIGLIYYKSENCYLVEYFKFELLNGKICKITKT